MSDPTHIISMTDAAFQTARETAADERQALIMAWINSDEAFALTNREIAHAIERGEHLKHAPE